MTNLPEPEYCLHCDYVNDIEAEVCWQCGHAIQRRDPKLDDLIKRAGSIGLDTILGVKYIV